ncbi:M protein repeat protein [Colletotrichum salicis]|uniref:M protein repeat protein n=1 Tax=Colletotrichum salicis TaxID=1209931 RepID=A0A135UKU5_9PEZI|nr:M protein repeat protein [Colletotrichum salicis]
MADAEEKAKAEKLAAARKRVEELKKKKTKKAAGSSKKEKAESTAAEPSVSKEKDAEAEPTTPADPATEDTKENEKEAAEAVAEQPGSPTASQPSLAQQSKLRSASFRQGFVSAGNGPLSPSAEGPEGETATDIYRKQHARIEELEKENKRLAKDSTDAERRWKKAEDELADLRETEGENKGGSDSQVENLKSEIEALQRQNSQLQQQASRAGGRHGLSPSVSMSSPPAELEAQLASKTATIESMEIEISKLRAQVDRQTSGTSSEKEQIAALEEKLARSEKAATKAQQELTDLRKNLDRTAEKAVREGSERTSAETKLRSLEHDLADSLDARLEAEKKADGLEKKVTTLTTLHKEQDSRTQTLRKEKERAEKEVSELKARVESLESENTRLRSRKSTEGGGGLDDDGVDELENEERLRLEKKVRDLEAEVYELRHGHWQEKRRELNSPSFENVDLGGSRGTSPSAQRKQAGAGGGIGDFFQSGINALTGTGDDELLLDDDDVDFDEDAFRRAQEEDAKKRLERIKEIKRTLKNWEGWRLDLVENRRGGSEGVGDVFEV